MFEKQMESCQLCPRMCKVNRKGGHRGMCGQTAELKVARAALHFWEEPCISGENGSGAVFFSGCSVGCVFCQNQKIARGQTGRIISVRRLADIFVELQEKGANNINLITPTHFVPQIAAALRLAKAEGMHLPVVYNTSGYEKKETIEQMNGLADIYLPDFKYWSSKLSQKYSAAADYSKVACSALEEMVRQVGRAEFDERGIMRRGVIVRLLLLPGQLDDAMTVVKYLYETYGDDIYISLMNQYTPLEHIKAFSELNRKVSKEEYDALVEYALSLGVENGFIQEGETAEESFIPEFDCEGV